MHRRADDGRDNFALSTKQQPKMENEQASPPPIEENDNGLSDTDLLHAISKHPDAAHALAAIASGADVSATLASLLSRQTEEESEITEDNTPQEPPQSIPVASPSFLGSSRTDFWDESFF